MLFNYIMDILEHLLLDLVLSNPFFHFNLIFTDLLQSVLLQEKLDQLHFLLHLFVLNDSLNQRYVLIFQDIGELKQDVITFYNVLHVIDQPHLFIQMQHCILLQASADQDLLNERMLIADLPKLLRLDLQEHEWLVLQVVEEVAEGTRSLRQHNELTEG